LFIVIFKQLFTANWTRSKSKGYLLGIIGIRRMKTISPVPDPVKIVASIILYINHVTLNRVPLHSLDGFKFLKIIIGVPTFNLIT